MLCPFKSISHYASTTSRINGRALIRKCLEVATLKLILKLNFFLNLDIEQIMKLYFQILLAYDYITTKLKLDKRVYTYGKKRSLVRCIYFWTGSLLFGYPTRYKWRIPCSMFFFVFFMQYVIGSPTKFLLFSNSFSLPV